MRHAFAVILAVCLVAPPAQASERYLGKIVSGAGADTTNDGTATPFFVPKGAKLTVVCNAAAYICVDTATACTATAGSNPGLPVASGEKFPTSTGNPGISTNPTVSSATAANGGAWVRIMGSAAVTCDVYVRNGDE